MAERLIQESTLIAIADSIREKTGLTEPIDPTDFSEVIKDIASAELPDATATKREISSGKIAYGKSGRRLIGESPFIHWGTYSGDFLSSDWYALRYADNKFVATSRNGVAATLNASEESWTIQEGGQGSIIDFVYGNGKFVGVGSSGNIYTSENGLDWTSSASLLSTCYSITYGDGKFLVVSYSDTASFLSTDGINWERIEMPTGAWYATAYGDGKFVALSFNNDIGAYSVDGVNWTEFLLPTSAKWRCMTYANNTFVTIASESDVALYSEDGIAWTSTVLPSSLNWYSLTYGDGKFVTLPFDSDVGAYSTDGVNWVGISMPKQEQWRAVAYGNETFVAIAYASDVVAYSHDGITWVEGGSSVYTVPEELTNGLSLLANGETKSLKYVDGELTLGEPVDWVGELTFSGSKLNSECYTEAGCSLAADPIRGMVFLTIQSGTSTSYENIYFLNVTVPDGVTFLTTQKYGGPTGGTAQKYFTAAFTGVTGKVNVNVELSTTNTSYDYVQANVVMTYA